MDGRRRIRGRRHYPDVSTQGKERQMRTGWLRELQRVIAAQESLWNDDVATIRPRDGLLQYDVLSGKLGRLHQEVVASERRAPMRRRAAMWVPNTAAPSFRSPVGE